MGRFWRRSKRRLHRLSTLRHWLRPCHYIRHGHGAVTSLRRRLSQARRLTYDFNATGNGQPCSRTHRQSQQTRSHGRLIWVIALVSLTAAMGRPYLSQPQFDIGTIAPRTIYAPYDATVIDEMSTENRRQEARTGVTPVLSIDTQATEQIREDLRRFLLRGDEVRQLTQPFPIVSPENLSEEAQILLRKLPEETWRSLRSQLEEGTFRGRWLAQQMPFVKQGWQASWTHGETWRQAGQQLERLQNQWPGNGMPQLGNSFQFPETLTPTAPGNGDGSPLVAPSSSLATPTVAGRFPSLEALVQGMGLARQRYQIAIAELSRSTEQNIQVFDETLLSLTPDQWETVKDASQAALDRILLHGLPPGLTDEHRESIVGTTLGEELEQPLQPMANRLLVSVTKRPNLLQDSQKTREQAETAAEDVEFIEIARQRGEVIVAIGNPIDTSQFALLDHYGLSRREINWWGLVKLSGWVSVGLLVFWMVERRFGQRLRRPDHLLLLFLALSAPLSAWPAMLLPDRWGYGLIDLPLVGLLTGSFYGPAVGSVVCVLLGLLMPLS
ncbi:MAG: hypothetical protein AAGF75_08255, partial [Cyanobacteria bacterium P01_H01_bin.130]